MQNINLIISQKQKKLFGFPIKMECTLLDSGLHVLLAGGQKSHVGAVALAENGHILTTVAYPGHKEAVVAEQWALKLSKHFGCPATVACGIHYDNATRTQIEAVLAVSRELLTQTINTLEGGI